MMLTVVTLQTTLGQHTAPLAILARTSTACTTLFEPAWKHQHLPAAGGARSDLLAEQNGLPMSGEDAIVLGPTASGQRSPLE